MTAAAIPLGLCQCGCGHATRLATQNWPKWGHVIGRPLRFVRGRQSRVRFGERANHWQGGRYVDSDGYVMVAQSDHHRARNGYVAEHILVVERAMGKPITIEHPVHHVDENKQNNANENLVACEDHAYHMLLHRRLRAFLACDDANARRCSFCKDYGDQTDITVLLNGHSYHRRCAAGYERRRSQRSAQPVRNL